MEGTPKQKVKVIIKKGNIRWQRGGGAGWFPDRPKAIPSVFFKVGETVRATKGPRCARSTPLAYQRNKREREREKTKNT